MRVFLEGVEVREILLAKRVNEPSMFEIEV
jgi:hypothetical protein